MIGCRIDDCIEFRSDNGFGRSYFSVAWYPFTRDNHWPDMGPPVAELSVEWQGTNSGRIRICSWNIYDVQMRKMIGLAPRPDRASVPAVD